MENSKPKHFVFYGLVGVLLSLLVAGCALGSFQRLTSKVLKLELDTDITSNTVLYRYRFGGEIVAHYLDGVISVTIYQRSGAEKYDQVAFNLKDGRDYVLNGDVLMDYELLPGSMIEEYQELNKLYHHYDPYLQGYKQDLHKEWVNEQYLEWAGRLATEEEWLEALNELTRGVEHHQMERWIAYSPPAVENYVTNILEEVIEREPTSEEKAHIYRLILGGMQYEDLESFLIE